MIAIYDLLGKSTQADVESQAFAAISWFTIPEVVVYFW
jgi:hypothetical protein